MANDKEQKNPPKEGAEEKKYSFLQEKVKEKQGGREQIIKRCIRIAIYGLILGMFACLGFFALKPWMQRRSAGNTKTVTITDDEQSSENASENAAENEEKPSSDAKSFEEMTAEMNDRVKEAKKTIVSVSSIPTTEDQNSETTDVLQSVTGVITGDNGQELLIITDSSICTDASAWKATIANGKSFDAALKKLDNNRKIAVFGIEKNMVDETDRRSVKIAVLGNSNMVKKGDAVIALGNLFGYEDRVSYGTVSTLDYKESFFDGECKVISTDIPAEEQGTGALFNREGEVVGFISKSAQNDAGKNVVNAYGISDLKPVIELLVNGKSIPYIGIRGTTVTEQLSDEYKMPLGIYVVDVDPDSPAMTAGIQIGDIIYEASGKEINNVAAYQNIVTGSSVGETLKLVGKRLGSEGYVDIEFSVVTAEKEEVQ